MDSQILFLMSICIILKQLIDAAIHLESSHIFHRDIELANILIETGSDVPRLRLLNFSLSCFVEKTSCFNVFHSMPQHIPPEFDSRNTYVAECKEFLQMCVSEIPKQQPTVQELRCHPWLRQTHNTPSNPHRPHSN
ncbi:serine/threonine-protein kinase atg1-like [Stegastes partitus]|uniref:non-specific serine/threonine protein kinase n=1 Tax=Stegastes partitus TaxID=144197 RepID=A0A9Y4NIC7_9TELE|nr:PREDICTED: serine/threonine-protein kinase atg1-like [Stegastes partitus]